MSLNDVLNRLESVQSNAQCYEDRIARLKQMGRDSSLIQRGIADVLRVLEQGSKSFVVYGEPQSGKTEFMIALVCKLLDMGRQTIFVVMNDNTELELQNYDRFLKARELNPTPQLYSHIEQTDDADLKTPKQRVIFCRKNASNLKKLIHKCRFMTDRVVIDDEADYATPNAKTNKNDVTAINLNVGLLGDLGESGQGTYIGVTATPARLDLNNTFLNDSKNWVFLDSHSNYKGRQFFFPVTDKEIDNSNYQLVRLPDDTDDPKLLRHAVFRFLIRVAILNAPKDSELTAYSMLIHTKGTTNDHVKDHNDVSRILKHLADRSSSKFEQYANELLRIAGKLVGVHHSDCSDTELVVFILQNIGRSQVLTINHQNDGNNVKRAGNPESLFTFAIGGNIVSRGLTFENLLTFYFSRTVRGRLQQNTYIQRARMFGNRPYSEYFELCVPDTLLQDWATVFQDHEISLRLARAGTYQHVQSARTAVVDMGAIDKRTVTMENAERAVGEIFDLTPELEQLITQHDRSRPLSFIESLIKSNALDISHFPSSLVAYLREVARKDESDILIVLRSEGEHGVIQNIERYQKDGDPSTITRARGGIVHSLLNKRKEYFENNHFVLPIKNNNGQARLMYKSNIGQAILQNLKVHPPTN